MQKLFEQELVLFIMSILSGSSLVFVYDVIRCFRRIICHNTFCIALEDLIFWIMAAFYIFYILYRYNYGSIRGFAILGMFLGMILYTYTIGRFFVCSITKIIIRVQKIVKWWIRLLKRPYGFFIKCRKKRLKKNKETIKIEDIKKMIDKREQ